MKKKLIIVGFILMFQIIKLLFEIGERYVVTSVLTFFAPLAFSMGGSKNTNDIFKGWCRMYGSMMLMTIMNIVFLKLILSAMAHMTSGSVLVWLVFIVALTRVARKIDSHIGKIGLNPAQTVAAGSRLPGMMTMVAVRTMAATIGRNVSANRSSDRGSRSRASSSRGSHSSRYNESRHRHSDSSRINVSRAGSDSSYSSTVHTGAETGSGSGGIGGAGGMGGSGGVNGARCANGAYNPNGARYAGGASGVSGADGSNGANSTSVGHDVHRESSAHTHSGGLRGGYDSNGSHLSSIDTYPGYGKGIQDPHGKGASYSTNNTYNRGHGSDTNAKITDSARGTAPGGTHYGRADAIDVNRMASSQKSGSARSGGTYNNETHPNITARTGMIGASGSAADVTRLDQPHYGSGAGANGVSQTHTSEIRETPGHGVNKFAGSANYGPNDRPPLNKYPASAPSNNSSGGGNRDITINAPVTNSNNSPVSRISNTDRSMNDSRNMKNTVAQLETISKHVYELKGYTVVPLKEAYAQQI